SATTESWCAPVPAGSQRSVIGFSPAGGGGGVPPFPWGAAGWGGQAPPPLRPAGAVGVAARGARRRAEGGAGPRASRAAGGRAPAPGLFHAHRGLGGNPPPPAADVEAFADEVGRKVVEPRLAQRQAVQADLRELALGVEAALAVAGEIARREAELGNRDRP